MCFDWWRNFTNKEEYWNNKYPQVIILYDGRTIPKYGRYSVDVRTFFVNEHSYELQKIVEPWKCLPDDDKALSCLLWVMNNFVYRSDFSLFGTEEFWCYPSEALKVLQGDCDDGAILLANLMLASGIPYWKIRLTAGLVPEGGHAYVTYYCQKNDYWVALDWCYSPNRDIIEDRPDYKLSTIYIEVWFSWNQRYSFQKGTRTGMHCEVVK